MEVKSLGRKTDLIFARFNGQVIDRGSYTLIKTPSNPGYHWGNYIIFDEAPKKGDLKRWKEVFDREFEYYKEPHHYSFIWDLDDVMGEVEEFKMAGFELESSKILMTKDLVAPKFLNKDIEIRPIKTDDEWLEVEKLQTLCSDPKYLNEYYAEFKHNQMINYRKMADAGKGYWFGAFIGDQLIGDLGLYFENDVARYQNVGTHPDFRRKGICGTLVYRAGQYALENFGVDYLVMEADPYYHAGRIYESVGFKLHEINHSLGWWKQN